MITLKAAHIRHFKGIDDIIIQGCNAVNAFYGRNNSGKSTILHAIEMASLALSTRNWDQFPLKVDTKEMFHEEEGPFEIELIYADGRQLTVSQQAGGYGPTFKPNPTEEQIFHSIYIIPDPGLYRRRNMPPKTAMEIFSRRDFSAINGLEMLYALKFYAEESMKGFKKKDYEQIINDIKSFFPEIDEIISGLTEENFATLTYLEYDRKLDVIYSGAGLKHFVDIFVKSTLSQASVVLIDEPEMGLHPSLQRELLAHLLKLNEEKGTQFFLATHSPIFLSEPKKVTSFIMQNKKGKRAAEPVIMDSLYTFWDDLGIRPGDLLQNDIVVLVEGQDDIIFFERVLELYREEFHRIATAVVQYGGDAPLGIIDGTIKLENIVSGRSLHLWIRDRHSSPTKDKPHPSSIHFKNALEKSGEKCHIFEKREVEFYYPEDVHIKAQDGDRNKEEAVLEILKGDQPAKFDNLAKGKCTVARGKNLRRLLQENLRRDNLDKEIRQMVEEILIPWCREIRGG